MAQHLAAVALIMSSPFIPVSFWALFTQNVRDKALPSTATVKRAFMLVPCLLFSEQSPIRVATALNLVGVLTAAGMIVMW